VHFIPTGEIKIVTNRSYGHAFAILDVPVAEDADVEQAMRAMHEVAEGLRREPAFAKLILEPIDVAGVDGWAEGALRIKARLKVAAGSDAKVRREMLRRLRERATSGASRGRLRSIHRRGFRDAQPHRARAWQGDALPRESRKYQWRRRGSALGDVHIAAGAPSRSRQSPSAPPVRADQ
jgi:hypothetical protein